jgi:hypothetical protein
VFFHIVDGTLPADDLCHHLFIPGVHWQTLDAQFDAELELARRPVAALGPGGEVEDPTAAGDVVDVDGAVVCSAVREEHQVLLRVVLDHPRFTPADAELFI